MKLIHDNSGQLVSVGQLQLNEELAKLEVQLDAIGVEKRNALVEHLRSEWSKNGTELTVEDNNVLALFCEEVLDFRNLADHFGQKFYSIFTKEPE